jgi:hypothetical protein
MSQENCTTTKNYKHSRDQVVEILTEVKRGLNEEKDIFRGYIKGVNFALELLEDEWNLSKD